MPDQYGNPTEAELRGQLPAGMAAPNYLSYQAPSYSGTVGGKNVQIYGNAPLSQDQALNSLRQNNSQGAGYGAVDPTFWASMNPGLSAEDLAAYKKLHEQYRAQTDGMSLGAKVGNAANFELDRMGHLIKGVANDPSRLIFGVDPIGTKIGNTVTGSNNQALVGQLGGATENDFSRYEGQHGFGSLGAARAGSTAANYIAAIGGAAGAAHGLGQAYQGLTGGSDSSVPMQTYHGGVNNLSQVSSTAEPAGSAGGAFANGGAGGLAGVGGGSAGSLAASGGISGGAGIGGTTGGALGGLSGVANSIGGTGASGGSMAGSGNLWGNLLTLGGSLYNTYQQQQGARDASRASQAGDANAIAEQRRQFDLSRADQAPWLASGTAALNRLNDPTAFTASPSYNFVRGEALGGVQNSAAARGGLFSGNAGRALEDRAANVASQEYGNWFNQQSNLAGLGQASAQSLGGLGANSANNVSNLLSNQGNARASGIVDATNARTGGINDLSTLIGNYLRNRQWGGG